MINGYLRGWYSSALVYRCTLHVCHASVTVTATTVTLAAVPLTSCLSPLPWMALTSHQLPIWAAQNMCRLFTTSQVSIDWFLFMFVCLPVYLRLCFNSEYGVHAFVLVCVCVCVFICVCMHVHMHMCVCVCVCTCVCLSLYIYVCLCVCVYTCLPLWFLYFCLSLCLSVLQSLCQWASALLWMHYGVLWDKVSALG